MDNYAKLLHKNARLFRGKRKPRRALAGASSKQVESRLYLSEEKHVHLVSMREPEVSSVTMLGVILHVIKQFLNEVHVEAGYGWRRSLGVNLHVEVCVPVYEFLE